MKRDCDEIRRTDSLRDGPNREVDADAGEAWRKVIRRRLAELDSGAVTAIPWSEARLKLLARLPK